MSDSGRPDTPMGAALRARSGSAGRIPEERSDTYLRQAVIHEVDEALRALVRRDALRGTDVDVAFEAPTRDWSSRRNTPTIDIYFYDIREDTGRREIGRLVERDQDGRLIARTTPPRWFKLSYLVTAWTQRPEDEHRLLAAVLQCFTRIQALPAELLTGSLAAGAHSLPVTCALPPPQDRALSDVWSALGGELKPSLDVVVVAPLDPEAEITFAPPVLEPIRLDLHRTEGPVDRSEGPSSEPSEDPSDEPEASGDRPPPDGPRSRSTRRKPGR